MNVSRAVAEELMRLVLGKKDQAAGKYRLTMRGRSNSQMDHEWEGDYYPDKRGVPFGVALSAHVLKDLAMKLVQAQASEAAGSVHLLAEATLAMNDVRSIKQDGGSRFSGMYGQAEGIARQGIIFQYRKNTALHKQAVNFSGGAKPNLTYFAVRFELEEDLVPCINIHLFTTKTASLAYPDKMGAPSALHKYVTAEAGDRYTYILSGGTLMKT